ncbi:hypothetical protein MKW92_012216 [Papaver armeniacum]|nr:hypothetical protein MKW92_012216 [Papaver armeniacum]
MKMKVMLARTSIYESGKSVYEICCPCSSAHAPVSGQRCGCEVYRCCWDWKRLERIENTRCIHLCAPPGVGKTLVAKAVAGEAGMNLFSISASQLIEIYAGVGASHV